MTPSSGSSVQPAKRRKLDVAARGQAQGVSEFSASLSRPVSPPVSRRNSPTPSNSLLVPLPTWGFDDVHKQTQVQPPHQQPGKFKQPNGSVPGEEGESKQRNDDEKPSNDVRCLPSPFQLTRIRDLAPHQNVDTVQLKDILGDPLIKECWNFNFLFDPDFVMQQFDGDVRDMVKVKIVHGFWKRDDERRIHMMEMAERYPNIELINAYLPDPFGTHHSKMIILFRHDDHAQIIIHTANMISKDWTNMTQAVWRSPLLRLSQVPLVMGPHPIGSGLRFHVDLRNYLLKYEKRLKRLVDQLSGYDFSDMRAAFLGSAPSRQVISEADPALRTSFGWLGLQEILSSVPITAEKKPGKRPHIVLQVSSIATLGAAPTWLSHLQTVLSRSRTEQPFANASKPKFNVIFPTAEEIRTSLDGYESGGSIHVKLQSTQQQKQLQYMHPLLCHWKPITSCTPTTPAASTEEAHRGPAAPHIKTYTRFTDDTHESVDWALVTSANLSKQAWGDALNKQGEVRIQSYETGVLVWPELFAPKNARHEWETNMVPVFRKDTPDVSEEVAELRDAVELDDEETEDEETEDESETLIRNSVPQQTKGKQRAALGSKKRILVGLRMPYNLPLVSYSADDTPWCATQSYTEPDWQGRAWTGFQPR